ncbi:unnamed protein product [Auanema sp. JU1783]|nr:unnamed protein product [Auanema sp. JU1783]
MIPTMDGVAWHFTGPPGCEVDDLGFKRPWDNHGCAASDTPFELGQLAYEEFWMEYCQILIRRQKRWDQIDPRRNPKCLRRFIHKGIPHVLRKDIWLRNSPPRGTPDPNYTVPFEVVESIRKDLQRTFPDNIFLSTTTSRNALGRMLFHLAHHVPLIGYCQGLNFVAGLILLVVKDENRATDLLISQVSKRQEMYDPKLSGLRRDIRVLHALLWSRCEKFCNLLDELNIGLELFVTKWFVCWYVEVLPMETVLRIWDCLFYDGDVWLFRIAVRLIREHQNILIRAKTIDQLIQAFNDLGKTAYALNCHRLLADAKFEPIDQNLVDKLRASEELDYDEMESEEASDKLTKT